MAGYTRQSIADIINGSEVTAPPLNAEFNQMAAAFNGATGHSHDGSTGNAPKIDLATSVSGYLPAVNGGFGGKNNFAATTNPLATDDAGDGYAPGSMWENTTTGRVFICVGNTSNAAVWRELVQVQTANKIIPEATDTVDLGEPSTRFQDLWLSGGLSAFGNGSLGGTLTVTGATALGSTLAVTGDATFGNLTATGTTVITSVDLNSGAIDSTAIGTTTPAAGTFTTLNANTSLVAATADINGGTVDGATIGASTPSTGAFTDLDASGTATLATVDINAGAIDGTVIGATSHTSGKFTTLQSTGQATLATADINGGTIDGATIGATSASTITGTTITGTSLVGPVTGNVTGNTAGTHTGPVTGAVTGNLTGNVSSSGTSTFNNVTIDGTLNMNAGTSATITNLSAPTNDNDAARKIDVDNAVANLVDSAPGTLDTLNELAAALGDDADFSTTITNSIATKLPLAGGTMTGAIAMSTNKITGVGDPTAAQDVSSKAYTDQQDALQVTKSGDSMSGNLAMGSNNITGLATPTANDHAVNKSYADNILGSSTAAATSASNAATSESNAATSETNAANSATAAAGSATSAAASYDDFDDRYLGAKATAPTVDNDGDALIVGALYFNSTSNIMYVYGGAGWQAAGSSVNGTSDRNTYTATAGQTVFAATYDTGYVDVYLNGVKLVAGTDFTATNGTSITLATGAAVNDVVDIVAYGTFVLADHYTEAQSDARYVQVAGDTMTGNLDVGGTVTADGLTVDQGGTATINLSSSAGSWGMLAFGDPDDADVGRFFYNHGDNTLTTRTSATNRMQIAGNGDISFYDDSDNAKFFWDASASSLGIGTASPSSWSSAQNQLVVGDGSGDNGITIYSEGNGQGNLRFSDGTTGSQQYRGRVEYDHASDKLYLGAGGTTPFAIDSSGRVGIGTSSPTGVHSLAKVLELDGGDGSEINLGLTAANVAAGAFVGGIGFKNVDGSLGTAPHYAGIKSKTTSTLGTMDLRFYSGTGNYEADTPQMLLDASGHLLVGKTTNGSSVTGCELREEGFVIASMDGDHAAVFDRKTSDGVIVQLRKDNITVGSIGSRAGVVSYIALDPRSGGAGLTGGQALIYPSNNTGGITDGATDLGGSGGRFKDLYLSGGVYLGGTGSANKLDDVETGTWTPNVIGASSAGTTTYSASGAYGGYTKIGNLVTLTFYVSWTAMTGSGNLRITGMPFALAGNTSNDVSAGNCMTSDLNIPNGTNNLTLVGTNGDTYLRIFSSIDAGGLQQVQCDAGGATVWGQFTYRT